MEMRIRLSCLAFLVCICCERSTGSGSGAGSGASFAKDLCSAPLSEGKTVILDAGTHSLPGRYCVTANATDLTVRGSTDGQTVIECTPESVSGFLFRNIVNITLERITFRNCGRTLSSDLRGNINSLVGKKQRIGLLFDNCTNIKLRSVTLEQYCGSAIVIINGMGRTTLRDVQVSNDGAFTSAGFKSNCSGAGIALIYTDHAQHSVESTNTYLDMVNVNLANNTLEVPRDQLLQLKSSTVGSDMDPVLLSGASGLFLYTGQLSYHLTAVIRDCIFENNRGDVGAVLVTFHKTIRNTRLLVQDTVFTNNVASPENLGQGGAITFAFSLSNQLFSLPSSTTHDAVTVTGCTFDGNMAESGGAMFIKQSPQNASVYRIEISNSTFSNNAALFGAAIRSTGLKSTFVPKDPYVFLNDIDVYGNRLLSKAATLQDTAVLLFTGINNIEITGSGRNEKRSRFHDNDMSALLTSNTNIVLRGWIEFYNNHGFHGGAITLYDNGILFFHEGSNVTFEGNTAVQSGGAIHADSLGSSVAQTCVIQFLGPSKISGPNIQALDLSITFRNNFAGESGNSIFGDPLYQCYNIPESSIIDTSFYEDIDELYNSIFNIESTVDNGLSNVASSPENICVCSNSIFNSSECEFQMESFSKNMSVVPGQTFEMYLVPLDRAGHPVASILSSSILENNSQSEYILGRDQGFRSLPGTTSCTATQFVIYGPEKGDLTLSLSSSLTNLKTVINVTVERCPPGFVLRSRNSLRQCVCSDFVMDTIGTTCNETIYTITRQEQVWFGLHETNNVSSDVVYVSTCPVGHCNDRIIDIDLTIPDHLCVSGRTGLLCGACKSGLSTVFGSASCLECSNAWLAMILVFGILGVVLVALLFILDLTVTHGTITGLIFYVNIVSVNHSIFFRGSNHGFLFVFISLLNLELGYPQCFYDGMNDVVKVGLQYVFPAYLLLICIVIILLSRWMSTMQRLTAKCGIHVLSTIFYLIYSKILRTAIDTFSFATLFSDQLDPVTLWLFDGNIHFFEGFHLFLFLLALTATLVFLVPYPLYLTLIHVTSKYRISSPHRIKPFLDAYLAPYKDKWRFWFGLRVTILFVVYVIFAIKGTDDPGLNLLIQSLIVLVFMVFQANCQPFKCLAISALDLFFLLNYTILSLATTHIVNTEHYESKQDKIVSFLVSLVFIVFCGIIGYHVYLTLLKFETFKQISDKYLGVIKDFYNKKIGNVPERSPSEERRDTLENGDSVKVARRVTRSVVQLTNGDVESVTVNGYDSERYREPVLEYMSINTTSHV